MVHILASIAFSFLALGMFALIAFMLLADQDKIMTALGIQPAAIRHPAARRVRVRTAGRWQAASVQASRPRRAAA